VCVSAGTYVGASQQVEAAGLRCEISLWTKGVKDMDPFIFDGCYKNPKRIRKIMSVLQYSAS
jgi:hypothetical protein